MQNAISAILELSDGTVFKGLSFGFQQAVAGEVVFNTSMTGYPESLTDPSYRGQILVATYPLIGNYGVPSDGNVAGISRFFESDNIQVTALIISDYSFEFSHWNADKSLSDWLIANEIPGIYGIDTRSLTQHLRENGAMLGRIYFNEKPEWYDPNEANLVEQVSIKEKRVYGNGKHKIALVDCGVKNNIIRCFLKRDCTIVRVPWNYDFTSEEFDGIFVSNGPGNPETCELTIKSLEKSMKQEIPTFGICLGNQLMALASGAKTYKLQYGHRGHNQPVIETGTNTCYITSQNHGYAIDIKTLQKEWKPMFLNLNDKSCEGIKHESKPFFAVQFHPEASSGPTDTEYLFDEFIALIEKNKETK